MKHIHNITKTSKMPNCNTRRAAEDALSIIHQINNGRVNEIFKISCYNERSAKSVYSNIHYHKQQKHFKNDFRTKQDKNNVFVEIKGINKNYNNDNM